MDTGAISPSVADQSGTDQAWSNPDNIKASDDTYATCSFSGTQFSNRLTGSGFSFGIPSTATIDGILVEVEIDSTGANVPVFENVIVSDGTNTGNRAAGEPVPTTEQYVSYGGSADTWEIVWDAATIDSDFSVYITLAGGGLFQSHAVSVDHFRVTIYYTEGGEPGVSIRMLASLGVGT
jgi:hypothetical protein